MKRIWSYFFRWIPKNTEGNMPTYRIGVGGKKIKIPGGYTLDRVLMDGSFPYSLKVDGASYHYRA